MSKHIIRISDDAIPTDIPADEQKELKALAFLSDDALWTIARERLQSTVQTRLSTLMDKNSDGTITSEEYAELEGLVERGNRLTLRKATAMRYLIGRGHQVTMDYL